MSKLSRQIIIEHTRNIFAIHGADHVSIRDIAKSLKATPSNIYYYYPDKETLLKEMFDITRRELGQKRKTLDNNKPFTDLLYDRILFQFDNSQLVATVLKYFFSHHSYFPPNYLGYVPTTAYQHIKEILELGQARQEITSTNIDSDAKIITHSINGFVLEYYPHPIPQEQKQKFAHQLSIFFSKSLRKEVN